MWFFDLFISCILHDSLTCLRAFCHAIHWSTHKLYNTGFINLPTSCVPHNSSTYLHVVSQNLADINPTIVGLAYLLFETLHTTWFINLPTSFMSRDIDLPASYILQDWLICPQAIFHVTLICLLAVYYRIY